MTVFSLLNVTSRNGKKVNGYWLQDHVGTLKSAQIRAQAVRAANGNNIEVAVVPQINSTTPALNFWSDLDELR